MAIADVATPAAAFRFSPLFRRLTLIFSLAAADIAATLR